MKRSTIVLSILTFSSMSFLSAHIIRIKASSPPVTRITLYSANTSHALNHPTGILYQAEPGFQHLFVADSGHNRIVDISNGVVNPVAGDGTAGLSNGPTNSSQFKYPTGVSGPGWVTVRGQKTAEYPSGIVLARYLQLYVFDSQNNAIRSICLVSIASTCPDGTKNEVTTLAGGVTAGFADGVGTSAQVNSVTHGTSGYTGSPQMQFFADTANNSIRMIQSSSGTSGTVSSFNSNSSPGYVDGPLSSARFNSPMALTTNKNGTYWVMDTGNFRIRRIDPSNVVTTFAGSGIQGYVDGPAASAQFGSPMGAVYNPNDGSVYVADTVNNCIRKIDSAGTVSTLAGSRSAGSNDGTLSQAHFTHPVGLSLDLVHTNPPRLFVTDTMNNSVRMVDLSTGTVSTIAK